MAKAILTWTDSSDVALSADHPFGDVGPGSEGTLVTQRLHNDLAGAGLDDARKILLIAMARLPPDTEWSRAGIDLLDARALQVRSTTIPELAAFRPMGTGIDLSVPDLVAGTFHEFEVKPAPPVGGSEVLVEFKLSVAIRSEYAVADPFAAPIGIFRGIGRGLQNLLTAAFSRASAIVASGTDTLEVPDYVWYHQGVPLVELDHDDTISNLDGSTVALSATESYIFILVLDATAVTIVKGDLAVGPTFPADAPATPAGSVLLGWGERFADADATDMDFTELEGASPKFANVETSGLTATIKSAVLITGGRKSQDRSDTLVPMVDDETNTIQWLPDGSGATTTDDSLFQPDALILVDIVVVAGVEVSRVERRRWADRAEIFDFTWVEPNNPSQATTEVQVFNPTSRNYWIAPDQLMLQVENIAGTSGAATVDVFIKEPDVAAVTLFTSFATDDRRPSIPFNSGTNLAFGLPELLKWPPRSALVAVISITGDMTGDWAILSLVAHAE